MVLGRLYHASVPLQTTITPESLYMASIDPPGNVAGEIARYRRRFFAELGEPSARAFPEAATLLFARRRGRLSSPAGKEGLPLPPRRERDRLLAKAVSGIEGDFATGRLLIVGALYFHELEGPVEELALALSDLLPSCGLEESSGPIPARAGFFIGRRAEGARSFIIDPPDLTFGPCRLVLYKLSLGKDPFGAQVVDGDSRSVAAQVELLHPIPLGETRDHDAITASTLGVDEGFFRRVGELRRPDEIGIVRQATGKGRRELDIGHPMPELSEARPEPVDETQGRPVIRSWKDDGELRTAIAAHDVGSP